MSSFDGTFRFRPFAARFDGGECEVCLNDLEEGEQIGYDEYGALVHAECRGETAEPVKDIPTKTFSLDVDELSFELPKPKPKVCPKCFLEYSLDGSCGCDPVEPGPGYWEKGDY